MFYVREEHPLQQGLRHMGFPPPLNIHQVREEHPLQQGLRLNCSAISPFSLSQRRTSITTRIKTEGSYYLSLHSINVREEHPLQQGLRLGNGCLNVTNVHGQRRTSITTRIKTDTYFPKGILFCCVREEHPLQQGLRPKALSINMPPNLIVREEHPLQQGLRHQAPDSLPRDFALSEKNIHYNKD